MANINNFSLVGIGSSVKLGKGGITLAQSSGKLTVTGNNVALESYVDDSITALNLGTMSTETASDYIKAAAIASTYETIANVTSGLALKLNLTGGTLTGALTLAGAPTADLHAATKKYVDDAVQGITNLDALVFKGMLDGDTDATALAAIEATAENGDVYRIQTVGAATFADQTFDVNIGDFVAYIGGGEWVKFDNTDPVVSEGTGIDVTGSAYEGWTIALNATASMISFTPAGTISATDVAGALAELDTEKLAASDAASTYETISNVTSGLALKLNLTGGTMSGAIAMGSNKITGLGTPTDDNDAATKKYVDDTLASAVAGGMYTAKAAFTNANGSVTILSSIPAGATISRITVKVTGASTGGTSPVVTVERGAQVLDNGSGSDLEATGTYVIDSFDSVVASGSLTLTVANGGGTGAAGTVFVEYSL